MNKHLFITTAVALLTGVTVQASIIPVSAVYGHNEKNNFDGKINDMIIGSGMNGYGIDGTPGWPVGEGDPSTWTATSAAYQAEWQSQDLLGAGENPTNGKIGWTIFDLGSPTAGLEELYIWHIRENNGRVAASFNVYFANSPTVAPAHGPTNNTSIDYNFASGGWTQVGGTLNGTFRGTSVVPLGDVTGQYIGLEILSNNGDANRVGFAEIGITASAVPEPGSVALFGLGLAGILHYRRR